MYFPPNAPKRDPFIFGPKRPFPSQPTATPLDTYFSTKRRFAYVPLQYCADLDRSPGELQVYALTAPSKRVFRDNIQCPCSVNSHVRLVAGHWIPWCDWQNVDPEQAPPDDIARFVFEKLNEGRSKAWCDSIITAIQVYRYSRGYEYLSSLALRTAKRIIRRRTTKKKPPLTIHQYAFLFTAVNCMNPFMRARDRALLAVLWNSSMRPGELVNLRVEDIEYLPFGAVLHIPHSKTDQDGRGQTVTISCQHNGPVCPVHALKEWCSMAGLTSGAVFRALSSGDHVLERPLYVESVNVIIRRYTTLLRLDPQITAYSFRRGSVTYARTVGATLEQCKRQLRHEDVKTTRGYTVDLPTPPEQSISRMLW
jgi:integrase